MPDLLLSLAAIAFVFLLAGFLLVGGVATAVALPAVYRFARGDGR